MPQIYCSNISHINWINTIPILENNELHIHYFNLQENISLIESFFYLLTDDEKSKAEKYRQLNDKNLYNLGKITTKLLLSFYNKCKPGEIEIVSFKNKKPVIKTSSNLSNPVVADFNISHSKNILLVAIGKNEVGIDVEEIAEVLYEDVMQKSFTEEEINFVKNNRNPSLAFFTIWTRKEALLKTNGVGIIDELSRFQVLDGNNTTSLEVFKFKDYSVFTFTINEFYIGSVSYESVNAKRLKFIKTNLSQFV